MASYTFMTFAALADETRILMPVCIMVYLDLFSKYNMSYLTSCFDVICSTR